MSKSVPANTKRSEAQKQAAKKRPQTWPKGVSANPGGAPKRGESWAEIIKIVGEMTDSEFIKLKHSNPTQKQQVIMAAYMAMKNDPQPGVFNTLMDRAEGKVPDKLLINWREEAKKYGVDPAWEITKFEQALITGKADDSD